MQIRTHICFLRFASQLQRLNVLHVTETAIKNARTGARLVTWRLEPYDLLTPYSEACPQMHDDNENTWSCGISERKSNGLVTEVSMGCRQTKQCQREWRANFICTNCFRSVGEELTSLVMFKNLVSLIIEPK